MDVEVIDYSIKDGINAVSIVSTLIADIVNYGTMWNLNVVGDPDVTNRIVKAKQIKSFSFDALGGETQLKVKYTEDGEVLQLDQVSSIRFSENYSVAVITFTDLTTVALDYNQIYQIIGTST